MRAALYLRVSTEEQRERQSIATQRDFGQRFCDLHEIPIADFYADDGVSGTVPLEQRQEGKRLLDDARAQKFDEVFVYKLDRLGREPRLILNAVKEFEDLGVVVKSMTEPFETSTPAGRFLLTILSGVAGLERDNIIQRSSEGIRRLVREGAWVGGIAPYGYRVQGKRREARLVVSDAPINGTGLTESDVIRLIFQMAGDEGKSCVVIADHLNQVGVPASCPRDGGEVPRGRRRRVTAGLWRDSQVRYMLRSTTYKGVHVYGKRPSNPRKAAPVFERAVPAIVDPALWDRAQSTLERNRLFCQRNAKNDYLLRGLAKCGHCGWTYIGTVYAGARRPTRKYYVCGGRHKGRKAVPDPAQRCRALAITGDIEDVVWADVERFLRDPQGVLDKLLECVRETTVDSASLKSQLTTLQAALAGKDEERTRVVGLFRRGRIDEDALDRQLEEIDRERTGLQDEIRELESTTDRASKVEAELVSSAGLLAALNHRLDQPLTPDLKRQIVRTLVEGIVVETVGEEPAWESHVRITYRFGVPGPPVDLAGNRGISALQALALPLGYAASGCCGDEEGTTAAGRAASQAGGGRRSQSRQDTLPRDCEIVLRGSGGGGRPPLQRLHPLLQHLQVGPVGEHPPALAPGDLAHEP